MLQQLHCTDKCIHYESMQLLQLLLVAGMLADLLKALLYPAGIAIAFPLE